MKITNFLVKFLEGLCFGTTYKDGNIKPGGGQIGAGGVYLLGKLSNFPTDVDWKHWKVSQLIAQHKIY